MIKTLKSRTGGLKSVRMLLSSKSKKD